MCRWFAYLAPAEECLLEDVLITPAHALSKQVHDHYLPNLISHVPGEITTEMEIAVRNRLQNVDGFGMVWYTAARSAFITEITGPRPAMYKYVNPPTKDPNFHSICANVSTTALFAHIRAATASAVVSINNHPFVFGRHTIMHNGEISNFSSIRRQMVQLMDRDAYENIHGTTDSEHIAALYMTFLAKSKPAASSSSSTSASAESTRPNWELQYSLAQMKAALTATIQAIISLQDQAEAAHQLLEPPEANSLNICTTDGRQMVAIRFRNHPVEQPPSLYWSTTAGVTLNRKYPDHPDGPQATPPPAYPPQPARSISAPNLHLRPINSAPEIHPKQDLLPATTHGPHVIVASEPTTYKSAEWALIEKNTAVLVDEHGAMRLEKVGL